MTPGVTQIVYSARYHVDIGSHVFPTAKYDAIYRELSAAGGWSWVEPALASWEDLALVHTDEYLEKVQTGAFTAEEIAEIELPWSPEIVDVFRLMTGGTVTAARLATETGLGIHAGGGFHHAFANHGEGFCFFNDVALAIRVLQRDRRIARAAIVDLDVHHGNGTSMIFDGDRSVFTFSMHQQHNYPMFKPRSALDVGLADRTGDDEYTARLRAALPQVMASNPDVVFYLAGADPFEGDQLGGLALTRAGLLERDRIVFDACLAGGLPLVVTLAGGYARRLEDTVAIHRATIELARETFDRAAGIP
jgi:acetoin utilization deacetylase AcuC-like enzyme